MLDNALTPFLAPSPFGLGAQEKEWLLLQRLTQLTAHHHLACPAYARIIDKAFPLFCEPPSLDALPYLPISLFKHRDLRSIPQKQVRVTVASSGTTGSKPSRIVLDAAGTKRSSEALAAILHDVIGPLRLPMLIIDCPSALQGKDGSLGARASAILGLMPFGRAHVFALNDDMTLNEAELNQFLKKYAKQPVFIYGFTFLLWQFLLPFLDQNQHDLSSALMLHSGGWKKLQEQSVSNTLFKQRFRSAAKLGSVVNFYGMAELPGVIFPEDENGALRVPNHAHVIIRDPSTLTPVTPGSPGLIQILNALPESYPGHSLLTEDLGVIDEQAPCDGQTVRILGRIPMAQPRGCSDVLALGL